MTLTQVATELAMDAGNLSRIERHDQHPKPPLARKIASFYGVSLEEVYGLTQETRDCAA
ncbi:MAG: helix-turn-helix transcriptional regulator [bacterium]|nr:helix-turn-helix transcriptional regulator [bacterium]